MEQIKKSKWLKGSALIEDEKQVYCRIFLHDFNSDEEANNTADLIVNLLNEHFKNQHNGNK
jgi:hypothetical protein